DSTSTMSSRIGISRSTSSSCSVLGTLSSSSAAPRCCMTTSNSPAVTFIPACVSTMLRPVYVQGPPVASHSWSTTSFLSRSMSVRANLPLARSSPPTRATHDSVSALIASPPPSRSYSDFVCIVICSPPDHLVRPLLPSGSRLDPAEVTPRTLLTVTANARADLLFRRNAPAYRSQAMPSTPQIPPCQPWPLSQHRNSRVCRSDAERGKTQWRSPNGHLQHRRWILSRMG